MGNSLGRSTSDGNSGRYDPGDIIPGKTFKNSFSNLEFQEAHTEFSLHPRTFYNFSQVAGINKSFTTHRRL